MTHPGAKPQGGSYTCAVSTGCAVPCEAFEAQVHSIFNTVVNLQVLGPDMLVTLYASDTTDLPQGIRLKPGDFSTLSFYPGQRVWVRDGLLRMAGSNATIDLRDARNWICDLSTLKADLSQPGSRTAWEWVRSQLVLCQAVRQQSAVVERITENRITAALNNLRGAAQAFYLGDAERAVQVLIGLGSGLTPAGDDILLGFYTGLAVSAGNNSIRQAFVLDFSKILRKEAARTNDISRTYLMMAAGGQISSSLFGLARALCQGDGLPNLSSAAQIVLDTGHTSGCDTVTGFLSGIAAWEIM